MKARVAPLILALLLCAAGLGHAAPAKRGLGPAIHGAKPGARVAVIQGSFDWVHDGHLELMESALTAKGADGRAKFDHVVVAPTRSYDRKPFLKASYARRVALLRAAIAEHPVLRGRVTVSEAQERLPSAPAEFISALSKAHPDLHLSYVLGSDSFNESRAWPGFAGLKSLKNVELLVTPRQGYPIAEAGRADQVLDTAKTKIAATDIRAALDRGDLSSIAHAVPNATRIALEAELVRREGSRKAGARLLPGPRTSYKSFATLARERPEGAVDLLAGVDEGKLPDETREHLATVQERLQAAHRELASEELSIRERGLDSKKGYTGKLIVQRRKGGKLSGQYLFKRMSAVDAKKVESLTLLANLLGVPTPMAIAHQLKEEGARHLAEQGVLVDWVPGLETTIQHDFAAMDPKVREALVVSRWFNEVIGNQDVWWGQFMRPKAAGQRQREILAIDFDGAFTRRDAAVVQKVMKEHFGIDRPIEDARWTDKRFAFESKVGWAPEHYDSKFTMYGPLFSAYVAGRIDLDLGRIKAQLSAVKQIPRSVIRKSMAGYLDAASAEHWGKVPLQAAERFVSPERFSRGLEQRIYRSVDEFSDFLDQLAQARKDPAHPMRAFYRDVVELK